MYRAGCRVGFSPPTQSFHQSYLCRYAPTCADKPMPSENGGNDGIGGLVQLGWVGGLKPTLHPALQPAIPAPQPTFTPSFPHHPHRFKPARKLSHRHSHKNGNLERKI
ncbi:hypothetical protein [Neisseria polysaccharea]|uniref:hypothetical protein n=1 Tax=Neisseria polysaccharea TaxID=489 RepID=UPI0027DF2F5F|nr:hypothetical protein [Neisseria polysaccharea]